MKRSRTFATALAAALLAALASSEARARSVLDDVDFTSAAYRTATAHDPHFADRSIWPACLQVEKTAYAKQTWPPARVMVWARTDVRQFSGNVLDPANWQVDGRPATNPPDENTDIVFPDGNYRVRSTQRADIRCRHATAGVGVFTALQVKVNARGNVWFKRGAICGGGSWSGPGDVFVRNDNPDYTRMNCLLANKIVINKAVEASVEFIGVGRTNDEFVNQSGTFLVAPNSQFCPGDRSMQYVFPGARMVLLSGSTFHKRNNQHAKTDIVVGGELLAGLPDRPLTRDCILGLSRKSKGTGDRHGRPDDVGLLVETGGKLHVYSADPKKARLVITHPGLQDGSWDPRQDGVEGKVPLRTDVVLQGNLKLDGILFDRIRKGGIMMTDPSIMKRWAVFYGTENDASPDALYTRLDGRYAVRVDLGVGGTAREELRELRNR